MKTENFYEKLKEEFLKSLSEEKLPWKRELCGRPLLAGYNQQSNFKYKGVNRLMLEITCQKEKYGTNAFMTFKQAKKNGWKLEDAKGKGVPIQYWIPYNKLLKKFITWDEYEEAKKNDGFSEITFTIYEKVFYVFNVKHVITENGKSLEDIILSSQLNERKESDITLAENILHSYCHLEGIKVNFTGARAFYSPISDEITLPERKNFFSDNSFIATFAHEVAHSTGHSKRLDRKLSENYEEENYAIEELRAEIASSFLCSDFNIPMESILHNEKAYVQSWCEGLKDAPRKLLKAINDAEKIAEFIESKGALKKAV